MRSILITWSLFFFFSLSLAAQNQDVSIQNLETQVAQAAQALDDAALLNTRTSENRRKIRQSSQSAAELLNHILNHDQLPDDEELRLLEPLVKSYGELIRQIGSRYIDPVVAPPTQGGWNTPYTQSQSKVQRTFQWLANQSQVFIVSLVADFSAATGLGYKPEGETRRFLHFPPPVTPIFGSDSKRNRTLKAVVTDLRKTLAQEYKESNGDQKELRQAAQLFKGLILELTSSEPIANAKHHLFHAMIVTVIAQLMVVSGVELWYERTELGADVFAVLYEVIAASMLYVRYTSSGLPVWRQGNRLRAMVSSGSKKIPLLCHLGLKSLAVK